MVDDVDPHDVACLHEASRQHRGHRSWGWDRPTDGCETTRSPAAPPRPPRERPRAGWTRLASSDPIERIVVRSTRCFGRAARCRTARRLGTRLRHQIRRNVLGHANVTRAAANQRAPAQFNRGNDLRRLRGTDALHAGQFAASSPGQPMQATHRLEHRVRELRARSPERTRARSGSRAARCPPGPEARHDRASRAACRTERSISRIAPRLWPTIRSAAHRTIRLRPA